ncbi:heptosyltransferase I [Kaistia sp. 32K]|uniref:lipopolysaccharide heptosyltransferase I n=1 Tax=Kaistia sp. 32K TaxID=2795690 RepID=UPI001915137F|nr:lipopolysaccharide heptosyltransferase I [Kaistia sp. 32K]BCP53389.1 heptosyltransferase I [Kaistia sp. 32K]
MRVLLVKLSSLGDVVHTYPAVTDAARAIPGLELDWVVDEAFAPLARLHPAVRNVVALPIRRMKKSPRETYPEMKQAVSALRGGGYDLLIDAQGLMKSALVGVFSGVKPRHGFGRGSARESLATWFYQVGHDIPETEHMVTRIRKLFAASLGYAMPTTEPDAGLVPDLANTGIRTRSGDGIVLIHGTSWATKTWTVEGWRGVAERCGAAGLGVKLFAHGATETERAAKIAAGLSHVEKVPAGGLDSIIPVIANAAGVVTVDTGLGHLAAAFGIPTIGLYGPTNPGLTGLVGPDVEEFLSTHDCAPCEQTTCRIKPDFGEGPPCLADQSPARVWQALALRLRLPSAQSL